MQLKTLMLGFSALGLLLVITTTGCGNDQGHTHTSVNQETAKLNARIIVADLVTKNKLDKSWATIPASSVVKKELDANSKWEIVFVNKNVSATNKQKLYVYLTSSGDFIETNFTGK